MTRQDEEAKKELFRNLTGPSSNASLAHNPVLDYKPDVAEKERVDNKLVSVLMRTFLIGFPDFPVIDPPNPPKIPFGSAFALDFQGRQYLITASHVIKFPSKSPGEKGIVHIWRNDKWNPLEVTVVGRGDASDPSDDIAVLATDNHLPTPITFSEESFEPSVNNILWGQRVHFCGFPYFQHIKTDIIEGCPMAMTKGAVLSGMWTETGTLPERRIGLFILDGINNRGFSGGPAVFQLREDRHAEFQVFGVVRSYLPNEVEIKIQGEASGLTSMENTGLMHCPSIMRAVDMIEANPIGFELPNYF